jgi:hypothetical protein
VKWPLTGARRTFDDAKRIVISYSHIPPHLVHLKTYKQKNEMNLEIPSLTLVMITSKR